MRQEGVVIRATVAAASPLTIRETAGSTPLPATKMPGSSFTPTAGARCLAVFVGDRYYVIGGG